MRRAALFAAVAIALVAVHTPAAEAQRKKYGDFVKAAELLADWRYDDARALIAELARRSPKAAETRWLRAELAFLDGEYPRTLELLEGLGDDVASGSVGRLRALAASTLSVTESYAHKESSGGHFVIYYPPGKDEVIVDLAGDVLESAYERLGEDFGWKPSEKIRVEILERPADLARVSTLTENEIETTGTIALCKYGKLMVVTPRATLFGYPWMDTLVHEYVHYVVSRISHDEIPVWLHEGLARFQQVRWRSDPSDDMPAVDEHLLARALEKGELISFDDMHPSMAKLPSQQAAALAFAEVFTMVAFVHSKVGYEGIREVITLARDGKGARVAVAEAMGGRWPQVERGWKRYLRARKLKTSKALRGRAEARRIRFDHGGEDDENVGVAEVSSDKAREYARLGGILRSRGMPRAAAVEYEKALAIVGSGDPFVAAKLSRTYLELQEYDKAIALAKPLAALDEHDAAPSITLGVAFLQLGRLDEAGPAFERALRVNPFDPTVRCGLAEVYDTQGDKARAAREREACTRLR